VGLPAFDSCRAAFGSSTAPTPLPLPLPPLDQVRCRTLVTCLRAHHIEDNPSSGASDLTVVGADNEFALVMAGSESLGSDAIVAYETEAPWER
jgi:hypothetical protein